MHRLAYLSHASDDFQQSDLTDILSVARRRNPAERLTGMLIYHDQTILQFLEGPKDKVDACFARIERDPRHYGVAILRNDAADSRAFSNWSMGFVEPEAMPAHMQSSMKSLKEISLRVGETRQLDISDGKQDVAAILQRFLSRVEPSALR